MKRPVAIAIIVGTLVMPGLSGVASGGFDPQSANGYYDQHQTQVSGTYEPLHGVEFAACTGDATIHWILWYAPGGAQDYIWTSTSPLFESGVTSTPVTVNGQYEPVLGDFDGDGCDDILWYAPGTAPDYVWWGDVDGEFVSTSVNVNGTYQPVSGLFDADSQVDIFWYAEGPGQEYLWTGRTDRAFDDAIGPTVNGSYQVVAYDLSPGEKLLFYAPGPAQDYTWSGISPGASAPASSTPVTINGHYEAMSSGSDFVLLYGDGPDPDYLITEFNPDGSLETVPGSINGTYVTGLRSLATDSLIVWHRPGPGADYLWRRID